MECCQIVRSLSLSLIHTHTHSPTHENRDIFQRTSRCTVLWMWWHLFTQEARHWILFFGNCLRNTFPHCFFSVWPTCELLTYLMFERLMKNFWYEVPLLICFKYLMLRKHPLSSPLIFFFFNSPWQTVTEIRLETGLKTLFLMTCLSCFLSTPCGLYRFYYISFVSWIKILIRNMANNL